MGFIGRRVNWMEEARLLEVAALSARVPDCQKLQMTA